MAKTDENLDKKAQLSTKQPIGSNKTKTLIRTHMINPISCLSTLEICIDILQYLAYSTPNKAATILQKTNVEDYKGLKCLELLTKQKLTITTAQQDVDSYSITERGIKALQYFNRLAITLPTIQESHLLTT